jgi:putative ABC transport system permease protein
MTRVAIKGLLHRKTRALLTSLAVVLGVAMISGTFVLTDTIQKAFTNVFDTAYDKTSVIITGEEVARSPPPTRPSPPRCWSRSAHSPASQPRRAAWATPCG